MDLSMSPDLEAFHCYLIVILVGVFVAFSRVRNSLNGFSNIWTMRRTWTLLFLYAAVPVALYWFLDRTGAIQDTSLFSALIVGLGYERILAGSNSTLQTPENLSQLWSPLLAYANRTAEEIGIKAHRKDMRLRRALIARISADDKLIQAFLDLAEAKTFDITEFQNAIAAIDADASLGKEMKVERKAQK